MTATVHYVVLDACALMPTILRRLLLRVAATGAYAPVWSARIGDEWRRNAARLWQMPLADLEADGIVERTEEGLTVTDAGQPFVRVVAARFDAYLKTGTAAYHSRAV